MIDAMCRLILAITESHSTMRSPEMYRRCGSRATDWEDRGWRSLVEGENVAHLPLRPLPHGRGCVVGASALHGSFVTAAWKEVRRRYCRPQYFAGRALGTPAVMIHRLPHPVEVPNARVAQSSVTAVSAMARRRYSQSPPRVQAAHAVDAVEEAVTACLPQRWPSRQALRRLPRWISIGCA